jgi:hypothetical protein
MEGAMPEVSRSPTLSDPSDSHPTTEPTTQNGLFTSRGSSIAFGIVGPLICFGLKPIILDDWVQREVPGLGFIGSYWIFCHAFVGLQVVTLAFWLWRGDRLGSMTGVVTGVFLSGAVFAGGLGLVMFPFSLMGIAVNGIGLLGLVPLFTSITYFAHARRANRQARVMLGGMRSTAFALLGGVLVFGIPVALQSQVSHYARQVVERALEVAARGDLSNATTLERFGLYANPDRLVEAYRAEGDADRRKHLASAYMKLTGSDIEARIRQLDD